MCKKYQVEDSARQARNLLKKADIKLYITIFSLVYPVKVKTFAKFYNDDAGSKKEIHSKKIAKNSRVKHNNILCALKIKHIIASTQKIPS